MKKPFLYLVGVLLLPALAGCHGPIPVNGGDYTEIKINFATGNALKTLTYNTGTPLTLPDGSVYTNGQLKPVWKYIADSLEIDLNDVSTAGQSAANMIQIAATGNFTSATIYGGTCAEEFLSYGAKGSFLNLNDYKDQLPDFFEYLESYETIRESITAYDGGIYYIPYIAEEDEFSKVFYGRENWVQALLDESDYQTETASLTVSYPGYWKGENARNASNVVVLQNEASDGGVLTADTAIRVLKSYIAETYPQYENASDLYLGIDAQYDIDELIALLRCMRLSPRTLSYVTTGAVIDSVEIVPFFFRTKNQREEIFKLINYFGGTRVYGTNTYTGKWYIDAENELQYTFMQDSVFEGIDYLKAIFFEGLINSDWDDQNNSANYRTILYGSDASSNIKQLGFMTFDFIPSTAASNPQGNVKAMLPPLTRLQNSDDTFCHYIEIPRTVMNQGWAISSSASEEEIAAALKLFNYFFTEQGIFVQNFGIPQVTADFENLYTTPKGAEVPTITDWLVEMADQHSSGDVASFTQDYLGIRLGIGYTADIGFEIQYMTEQAMEGYDLYLDAGVKTLGYNADNPLMKLTPPCFSFNRQEQSILNTISVGDYQMDLTYAYIKSSSNAVASVDVIRQSYLDSDIETFIATYQTAYRRVRK